MVTDHLDRPVLFLDVDGTLLPVGGIQRPSTLEEWNAKWQNAANPYLATIVPEPALLHRVDSACGLTEADLATLEEWLRAA